MSGRARRCVPRGTRPGLLAVLAAVLLLAACEESFTPLSQTDLQFSVFGYLDASADTQWIRVMPIRPLVPTEAGASDARVTLEPLGAGGIIELRDSLFRFTTHDHPEVGSEGLWVHNFWTTERIEPGASYRLSVRREGGTAAEVTVAIPPAYGVEVWLEQPHVASSESDLLQLTGVRHVPFVRAISQYYDDCGTFEETMAFPVASTGASTWAVAIRKVGLPPRPICGPLFAGHRRLWVVGSEAEWPTGGAATWALGVPDESSNVSNALGYVAGVLTRTVPYESCELLGPQPIPSHCRLRYDASSATLSGTVTEKRCGLGAFDTARVQLTEIDPPGAHRRVRPTLTNRTGAYEIAGLEAGVRYAFHVRAPTKRGDFGAIIRNFADHVDTLRFTAGERRRYEVELQALGPCGGI